MAKMAKSIIILSFFCAEMPEAIVLFVAFALSEHRFRFYWAHTLVVKSLFVVIK
jgi:hypothetical protein